MNKNQIVKYSKFVAKAETTSRRQHVNIIDDRTEEKIKIAKTEQLTRSYFELSGAYPYIFDALSYVCTHYKDAIMRQNDESETHYRVIVPKKAFEYFALDTYEKYEKSMMAELYKLAKEPKAKVLPLDLNHSILTVPIRVDLIHEDGTIISESTLKKYENLNGELPVKYIAIDFYKPLFKPLLTGKYGVSWFPLPKAFHAKMLDAMDRYKDLPEFNKPEFQKEELKPYAKTYRKIYLYMNLHDNGLGNKLRLDAMDMMLSCYPEIVKTKNNYRYLKWWESRLLIVKACLLFNKMAEEGLLEGVKFAPTKIQYDKKTRQFNITIVRENYRQIEKLTYEL